MSYKVIFKNGQVPEFIEIKEKSTTIFVGSNGSGKTRLAVKLEREFAHCSHRISAHRSIKLKPDIPKITESQAKKGLDRGNYEHNFTREQQRWKNDPFTHLLDDFDYLVQALFAEQSNTALLTYRDARSGILNREREAKFDKLIRIWSNLIPNKIMESTGDTILINPAGLNTKYSAAHMSDGERSLFYIIGQVLVAEPNALLIIDEPELHIHRAILGRLWDELEGARPDCTFVLITHDLEFAASRVGQKFVISEYFGDETWKIEPVPEDSGFSEELTTLILGSRRLVLFFEGASGSLDKMIYGACYPDWTIIPRGACHDVIHSVATMRANQKLTRILCCGIVDADDHDALYLEKFGVFVLPVAEIENLLLQPSVCRIILEAEGYKEIEITERLAALKKDLFSRVDDPGAIDRVVLQYCRRRIDRLLKKLI